MGCDIHIILERKHNGQWVGLTRMGYLPAKALSGTDGANFVRFKLKDRDYEFFWQVAGVRNGDGPEGTARGFPDDASSLAHMSISEDDDLHSHSWLTLSELAPILARVKHDCEIDEVLEGGAIATRVAGKLEGKLDPLTLIHEWVNDDIEYEHLDQYRVVFAFDN